MTTPVDWASAVNRRGADGNDGLISTEMTADHSPLPDELIARMAYQYVSFANGQGCLCRCSSCSWKLVSASIWRQLSVVVPTPDVVAGDRQPTHFPGGVHVVSASVRITTPL